MKKAITPFVFALLLIAGCWCGLAQQAPVAVEKSDAEKRKESFEIVWNTVNERFYDPTFHGVDWKKVRERYAPLIADATTDYEVHRLLQQMISELHQSHFLIIPKESIPKLLPSRSSDTSSTTETNDEDMLEELENEASTTPLDRIGYKLTERLSTGIGIELRVIKGQAVITRVEKDSAAARAGLRPGFVIKKVGSRSVETVIAQFESNTTFQSAFRGQLPLILLAAFINGERQSPVRLSYLDGSNRVRAATIQRERLKGEMSAAIGNLPAMYTEFEARTLPGGFGYIRFNAFMPGLMKKVCAALRAHHDDRGLVLDLRGNQGGLLGMIGGLSGLFQSSPAILGMMNARSGPGMVMAFPQRMPYSGPLVIMIDGSTQSAAEMFASGLQDNGRAVVVGQRSAGNTLPSTIMKLPTGALFQFAFANYVTSSGKSLEGRGIEPNIKVELTRRNLLTGRDPQLSAAISTLRSLASPRKELIADVSVTEPPPKAPAVTIEKADSEPPDPPDARPDTPPRPSNKDESTVTPITPGMPTAYQVIERYITAVGGRTALEELTSRVSRGTVELQTMGLNGTAEIYEEAPNKSTLLINVEGLGTIQQTYDGSIAWLQDPLDGYIKFSPAAAARIGSDAVFHRELRFKELYGDLKVVGKEKVNNRDAFIVSSASGSDEKWYFDAETGLMLRKGNTYYEDFREVDGVKLPFKVTDNTSYGFGVVVRLTEIKHNVPIDPSKFEETPDCFTKPEETIEKSKVKRQSKK
ncbi:MAG TPA: S41 family peptidase [Pyrinomonadaceae bacterium]|nr:S41 family peptidase [Pyrinomonadaceae bacterium]